MTATITKLGTSNDGGYYLYAYNRGEANDPGYWLGGLADALGVSGSVQAKDFISLLGGCDPQTGKKLVGTHKGRVPAYDMTLSTPKSLDIVRLAATSEVRAAIDRCEEKAIREVIDYIESNLPMVRRGKGGTILETGVIAAAIFRHEANRNGDPNRHYHVVIPNLSADASGKVRHANSKELYKWARVLGPMFRASLAKHLRRHVGLELEIPNTFGAKRASWFECVGVPKKLLEKWSSRKAEIDQSLTAYGLDRETSRPQFRSRINTSTRKSKERLAPLDVLAEQWRRDLRDHDFSSRDIVRSELKLTAAEKAKRLREAVRDTVNGLTETQSHFGLSDLLRGVAERMQDIGLTIPELSQKVGKAIERSKSLIHLQGDGVGRIFTTKSIWRYEERLLKDVSELRSREGAWVAERALDVVFRNRKSMTDEQAKAVSDLTERKGKGAIRLLQGVAGAGKTYTLDAVREAFQVAGYQVVGGAVSGLAKETLTKDANTPSRTVASFIYQIDGKSEAKRRNPFNSKSVVILDEASMVDLKPMQKLVSAVKKAKATLILVGDKKQLQAIGAGGPFNYLVERIKPAELNTNRRQGDKLDRQAVADIRSGKVKDSLENYLKRDRLKILDTRQETVAELVKSWAKAGAVRHPNNHAILTETRREAFYINARCQQKRIDAGEVSTKTSATLGTTKFYPGDRVLFNESIYLQGIKNGYRGEVISASSQRNSIRVRLDSQAAGKPKVVDIRLSDRGDESITLGYAATTHKMQGQTVEHAYVLLGGGMTDSNMAYTQLTRGKESTRLFVDALSCGDELTDLARAMAKDRTKTLAHEFDQKNSHSQSLT